MLINALILIGAFVVIMCIISIFIKDEKNIIEPHITNINNSFNTTECSNVKTNDYSDVNTNDEDIIKELLEMYKMDKDLDELLSKVKNLK